MKINQLAFLPLLVMINSCQFIQKKTEKPIVDDNMPTIVKTYYEKSGALKSEVTIKDKKQNGSAKRYYPTGELHTLVNYVDNVKQGETFWYYKSGQIYRLTPYVNGKMEGVRKVYYENGKLQAEIPYKNGKTTKGLKEYNARGTLIAGYPEIVFETCNNLLIDKKFILTCKMSNNTKKVTFYQEITDDKNQIRSIELKTKNGVAQIEYYIPSSITVDEKIVILAELKSSLGHTYRTTKTYNLKLDTH